MGAFRRHMRRRKFTKAFRIASERAYNKGEITEEQYVQAQKGANNREAMTQLLRATETHPDMLGGIQDWDWEAILKWVQDFLIPLIQSLIPILIAL